MELVFEGKDRGRRGAFVRMVGGEISAAIIHELNAALNGSNGSEVWGEEVARVRRMNREVGSSRQRLGGCARACGRKRNAPGGLVGPVSFLG